jgi:hypothetical protein
MEERGKQEESGNLQRSSLLRRLAQVKIDRKQRRKRYQYIIEKKRNEIQQQSEIESETQSAQFSTLVSSFESNTGEKEGDDKDEEDSVEIDTLHIAELELKTGNVKLDKMASMIAINALKDFETVLDHEKNVTETYGASDPNQQERPRLGFQMLGEDEVYHSACSPAFKTAAQYFEREARKDLIGFVNRQVAMNTSTPYGFFKRVLFNLPRERVNTSVQMVDTNVEQFMFLSLMGRLLGGERFCVPKASNGLSLTLTRPSWDTIDDEKVIQDRDLFLSNFEFLVNGCKRGQRFVITNMKLIFLERRDRRVSKVGHTNLVLIDTDRKKVRVFDPHGSCGTHVSATLQRMARYLEATNFTLDAVPCICPRLRRTKRKIKGVSRTGITVKAVQNTQSDIGFCEAWSSLFASAQMASPAESSESVVTRMIAASDKDPSLIKRFAHMATKMTPVARGVDAFDFANNIIKNLHKCI